MRVLAFGDSNTQGFYDYEGGWVARLIKFYGAQKTSPQDDEPYTVFNLGVSGDATDNLLDRLENEIKARNRSEKLIVVFAIGLNDSRTKSGKNYAEVSAYASNLEKLLEVASKYTEKILFVGLTPCDEDIANPVLWDETTGYTNLRIKQFDDALQAFCTEKSLLFVPVLEPFAAKQAEEQLLFDGVHPNDAGHQLIADLVRPKLEELTR